MKAGAREHAGLQLYLYLRYLLRVGRIFHFVSERGYLCAQFIRALPIFRSARFGACGQ
jgi:hypothetical protein